MKKVLFVLLLVASAFPGVPSAGALAAGLVYYAFSYWLNAFSFFATASRSASAAAGRCALGIDRGGIPYDRDVVNGGMAGGVFA